MADEIKYVPSYTGMQFHTVPMGYKFKGIRGPMGCLPCDTEVMTRRGWVRISEYRDGEEILQWDKSSYTSFFIKPKKYIVGDCDSMLQFDCGNHFRMTVTDNHRVPLYNWRGEFVVKSAAEVAAHPSKYTVPTTWAGDWDGNMMDDGMLRLWVAIVSDGSYPKRGKQCVFCLRKGRKIGRLLGILKSLKITYQISVRVRRDGAEERIITFDRPDLPKHFDWRLSGCSRKNAEIVIDEIRHWDGLYDEKYDCRFYTTNKQDADIIQYLAHSCGRNATISEKKDRRNELWSTNYTVYIAERESAKNKVMIRCDSAKITTIRPPDGKQYCFETDTGFFVVRQNGKIFITGNSGKSVACCWDIFYKSCDQIPLEVVEKGHKKRVRWSKWLIGRLTYPELVRTTIETWLQWFPQTDMVYSPEIEGRLELPHPENDGTLVRIDLEFFALNAKNIMNDLMSLEISGAWVNEATQVEWKKIDRIHDRLGRFQPVKSAKGVMLDSFGVIMDTNSPDESNWWRKMEEVTKPEGCVWLAQPPALLRREKDGRVWYEDNDGRDFKTRGIRPAENVEHLKEGFYYWHKMIGTKSEDDIRKLVLNEFGTSAGGKPVYPEYKDIVHNTKKVLPFCRGLNLLMGSDFGRTPCTVIAQMGEDGVLYVLDECVSDNMSAEQFIEEILRPKLMNKYGWPQIPHINFGDPAGMNKNEVVNISAIETFNNYHINTMPAPNTHGNDPIIRIDTVSELLRRGYNGNPAVQFSSNCETLIKGFRGHYKYRKMRTSEDGDERFSDVPDKNMYSHIQDAFQYLCMGVFKSGIDYSRGMMGGRFGNRQQKVVFGYDFGC